MSKTRFQQMFHFLHLTDSNDQVGFGQSGYDPLFKVKQLMDLLSHRFESVHEEELTVDGGYDLIQGRFGIQIVNMVALENSYPARTCTITGLCDRCWCPIIYIAQIHLLVNEKREMLGWLNASLKSTETREELSTTLYLQIRYKFVLNNSYVKKPVNA